jgi:DNA-binding HxlR family transcriptional regulator
VTTSEAPEDPGGAADPGVAALTRGVAVIQRRWTLLVVEALLRRGPLRFVDLRGELGGVSPNVLAQRLRELAVADVVRRRRLAAPAGSWVYELTAHGRRLESVLRELVSWQLVDRAPDHPLNGDIVEPRTHTS